MMSEQLITIASLVFRKLSRAGGVKGEFSGGGGGIRTPGTRERPTVFKTAAFDHSATPPAKSDT